VLQSFTGDASSHLVKYFVAMIMHLAPDLLAGELMGLMKSTTHLTNTCKVTWGIGGMPSHLDGFPTL
jgi:hypothetical protein